MSEWCQNKKCPQKKTQGQIRGNKGNKYYQSNKASKYYGGYWCSLRCREAWFQEHETTCMTAVGLIDKQTIPVDDAWYVEYSWGHYSYNHETERGEYTNQGYHLINKLKGVKQLITKEQAQTPEQRREDYQSLTIDDEQAKELAISLGLAS